MRSIAASGAQSRRDYRRYLLRMARDAGDGGREGLRILWRSYIP
jgi:hypothetical protein